MGDAPDCKNNPCIFGNTGGQRTNGRCRCLPVDTKPDVRRYIGAALAERDALRQEVERLKGDIKDIVREHDQAKPVWDRLEALAEEVVSLPNPYARIATLEAALRQAREWVDWEVVHTDEGRARKRAALARIDAALGAQQGKGEP